MKKSKALALLLASTMVVTSLAGCGSTDSSSSSSSSSSSTTEQSSTGAATTETGEQVAEVKKGEAIKDYYTYEVTSNEMETFNILYSQAAVDLNVLTNCIDGLLSNDAYGKLIPAIAESWETTDNGVTWTFKIRQGATWVDNNGNFKADVTAKDFLTGLEWVLNSAKNEAANESMPAELIAGAADYYEYTNDLVTNGKEDEALALTASDSTFLDMVGIAAPDDYTLVYTCLAEKPYFDTVTTYNCLYPLSQGLVDEIGVDGLKAATYDTIWYCGAYTITSYIQGNEKVLTKNPSYYNVNNVSLFDTVTIKMVDSADVAFQLYQNGDLDQVDLTESNLKTIYDDPSNPLHDQLVENQATKYSYQIHFNYNRHVAAESDELDTNWNTAIANTAFRQSWYYGLNLKSYFGRTNSINPLKCENNAYTMRGLCYLSDGKEYTSLVEDKLGLPASDGENQRRLDQAKFEELKTQAMFELKAQGVTFPVECHYFISASSQTALDTANVLKQAFSDCFGDDYITLVIDTYVSSLAKEVRNPRLHSIVINGWGADYGDPQNYLGQEVYDSPDAYYANYYSNINDAEGSDLIAIYKEFSEKVAAANAITSNLDERYKAYAEAEAFMIDNALVVPASYSVTWGLTHANNFSKPNGMYGIATNYRYVNWETRVDAYTTEEYKALEAAYNAAK